MVDQTQIHGKTDIEIALEHTGYGTFNYFLIITCGIILYVVNFECYSIGYILPAAKCDFDLSVNEKSLLTSIGFLGIMFTQFLWGFISDTRGRRKTLLFTLILAFIASLASAFAPNLWLFLLFRFINGSMISCASATVFAYCGEFIGIKYRSSSITAACIFIGLAVFMIPATGWLILPLEFNLNIHGLNFLSWRLFVFLGGALTIIACIALFFLPESPKFLLNVGKSDEALQVLTQIYKINTKNKLGQYPVTELMLEHENINTNGNLLLQFFQQLFSLFKLKYLPYTVLMCMLQFGVFATSSGWLLWYPDVLLQLSESTESATVCNTIVSNQYKNVTFTQDDVCTVDIDVSVYTQYLFIGAAYLVGFTIVTYIVKAVELKALLALFLCLSGLSAVVLYWITHKWIIDILFLCFLVFSGLCVGLVNCVVVELFPTHLRGMAVCVVMFSGRLGSVVSSSLIGYLLEWNCDATFFIYAASLLGCGTLSLFIPKLKS